MLGPRALAPKSLRLSALVIEVGKIIYLDSIMDQKFLIFGSLLLLLGGFGFYHILFNMILKSMKSQNWLTETGTIIQSNLKEKAGKNQTLFTPEVLYEYRVGSRTLKSTRVSFAPTVWQSSPSYANKVLGTYPVGSRVLVRYDPSAPEDSVLETNLKSSAFIMLLAPLFFAGMGGLLVFKTFTGG